MSKTSNIARNNLIVDLKSDPDGICITKVALKNSDMFKLIELSGEGTKKDAIEFAIHFTIMKKRESLKRHLVSKIPLESKVRGIINKREEMHDSSNELLDTSVTNEHYNHGNFC